MIKKIAITAVTIAMAGLLLAGCGAKEPTVNTKSDTAGTAQKKVLKLRTSVAASHPLTKAFNQLKKDFEAQTNGKYEVQIFGDSILGDENASLQGVKNGTIEMAQIATEAVASKDGNKELNVFSLPFLFTNYNAVDAVLDGSIGQEILNNSSTNDYVALDFLENGYKQFTNRVKELKTPDDFKGLKFRVTENEIHAAALKALGAETVQMEPAKAYGELRIGNLDGMDNPFATLLTKNVQETSPYFTHSSHIYTPWLFIINRKVYEAMTPQEQKEFKDDVHKAFVQERTDLRADEQNDIAQLKSKGATVTELNPQELKAFQDAMKPVYDQFADQIGGNLIQEIRTEVQKH